MFSQLAVLSLVALSSVSAQYLGDATFAGCISPDAVTSLTGVALTTATSLGSLTSCGSECFDAGYIDAAYQPGTACVCLTAPPTSDVFQDGATSDTCGGSDSQYLVTKSTFSYDTSYPLGITVGSATDEGVVASPEACFQACQGFTQAAYTVDASSANGLHCYCGNSLVFLGIAGSFDNDGVAAAVFAHDAGTQVGVSGYVKRKLRERLEMAQKAMREAHCPSGLTACVVPGGDDSFECIDVATELESCGGCKHGYFNAKSVNGTLGTDCTAMPGVALGAVTCAAGSCTIEACKPGFTLSSGGSCVVV